MDAPPGPHAGPAASLTDWLRERSDGQLAELLFRRPDLALPAPGDLPTLAGRLGIRTSVQRAVDGLDEFCLRLLEALVLSGADDREPADLHRAADMLGRSVPAGPTEPAVPTEPTGDAAPEVAGVPAGDPSAANGRLPADVLAAADELQALGLVWGARDALRLVPGARDAVGTYPAGLGRPAAHLLVNVPDLSVAPVLRALGLPPAGQPRAATAIAGALADPKRRAELLAGVDPEGREILERLAAGPPVGRLRAPTGGAEPDAAQRLLALGLLIPLDPQTVELPREIGLALRPIAVGPVSAHPPSVAVLARDPAELDRVGTTAVLETLRLVAVLGHSWTRLPAQQLRAGGVGTRELRRTARTLDVDEPFAVLLIEVMHAAGLLNSSRAIAPAYLPTPEFDEWLARPPAQRWSALASAWLAMPRLPSLVGQRGDRERVITALSPDAERGTVPALRAQAMAVLAELPPGAAPTARGDVLRRMAWQAPRRTGGQRPMFEAVLLEADLLGLTAAGGLTGYTRTLLAGARVDAERVLTDALPAPVDHFLVQPDLTIVVPGPPTPDLAAELDLTADLESSGGASVYRVTETSVRRALDAGRSGTEIAAQLAGRSRTPVPQALTYLIEDLSRRHGTLRTGAAGCYLRCDDEVLLARVLGERDVASLQLRRIAPTVVISPHPAAQVLEVLRAAGFAPAAEAPGGEVIALSEEPPRAPSRPPARGIRTRRAAEPGSELNDVVRRLRSGDELIELAHRARPVVQQVPGVTSAATMGLLREAIRTERKVLLGCAEPDGRASRHTIVPISMAGGFVRGHEESELGLRAFPLHRLIEVSFVGDDEEDPA